MSDCLFCRIARKEIPSSLVYEDDEILAFKDIAPQAPVHILIIPKLHVGGLNEVREEHRKLLSDIPLIAARIAREQGCSESGYRLLANCGPDAGQTVFHLHFHLLGGRPMGGRMVE